MNLITKAEASRILGISEVAIHHWQNKNPRPDFFMEDENGNLKIDTDKESWKAKLNGARKTGHAKKTLDGMNKKRELKKIVSSVVDGVEDDGEVETEKREKKNIPIPEGDAEIMELNRRAAIASLESEIFNAKIKEEKSKQEEIKTLEIKRDLAPMYLVKHFFSFAENMIQRSYRRFQEISPELEALYLGGKREDAVKFLLREQESITRDAVDKLKKSIKEEGYDMENIEK